MRIQLHHAPRAPTVVFNRVSKRYRRGPEVVEVLQHRDLAVSPGYFLAIRGAFNSGKTPVLNLLGGLDQADSGCIRVVGKRLDRLRQPELADWHAHHVDLVLPPHHRRPGLTAGGNVEMPLRLTRLDTAACRRRVRAALRLVGARECPQHQPLALSDGEVQRVGIGRAVVTDPDVVLCDEPTGDLDRRLGDEILASLQILSRKQEKPVVMATHGAHAAAMAERTVFMCQGVLHKEPQA